MYAKKIIIFSPTQSASISVCPSRKPERNGQPLDLLLDRSPSSSCKNARDEAE